MREAIQQPLNMTRVISFGFLTALLSLFQPIPIVSAQQLTGHVTHETGGTDTQGGASKPCPQHSIPNQILGEAGRANVDPQASPTDSKIAERSRRVRRTFSICFITCQLCSNAPPVATTDNMNSQSKEPSSLNRSVGTACLLRS